MKILERMCKEYFRTLKDLLKVLNSISKKEIERNISLKLNLEDAKRVIKHQLKNHQGLLTIESYVNLSLFIDRVEYNTKKYQDIKPLRKDFHHYYLNLKDHKGVNHG